MVTKKKISDDENVDLEALLEAEDYPAPELTDDITLALLSKESYENLRILNDALFEVVGRHLAACLVYLETLPELAYRHARHATRLAPRVAFVREMMGLAAYYNRQWTTAYAELCTSRRINGSNEYLPMIADCQRGMKNPTKAIDIANSTHANNLDIEPHVEMQIVAAGALSDLGEFEMAILTLNRELREKGTPTLSRLRLMEAKRTIYENAGMFDDAEKIDRKTDSLRRKLDDPNVEDFLIYDIEEESLSVQKINFEVPPSQPDVEELLDTAELAKTSKKPRRPSPRKTPAKPADASADKVPTKAPTKANASTKKADSKE